MLDVKVNQDELNREIRHLLARMPAKLREPVVKKLAFDVLQDVQVGIYTGGFGNPRRVDTARYVGGWRMAQADLGMGSVDTLGALPGDGYAVVTTTIGKTVAVLTNAVEYASYVEYGTTNMKAGNHVAVALQRAGDDAYQVVTELMRKTWKD